MKKHYLLTDLKRLVKGYELYVSIIGVAASLIFSLENEGFTNNCVVSTYLMATEMSGVMIAYVFCAFPFATVFCDDLENGYARYQVIRGNFTKYVLSKVSIIYVTSIITMILGTILFLAVYKTQGPWIDWESGSIQVTMAGAYSGLITGGHFFLYCVLYALQLGLLAGILSAFAAFLSLYITNKVTVLVLPVLVYQILLEYAGSGKFNIFIFRAYAKPFQQDWQCFLFVFMLSFIFVSGFTFGIYRKLKTKL